MTSETHSGIIAAGNGWSVVVQVNADIGAVLTFNRAGALQAQIALTPREMDNLCAMWANVQPDSEQEGGDQ